jgi:prepilin-type N-terminal cleavage/methylation domain-containing protein
MAESESRAIGRRSGFTIIELVLVLFLMGILFSITVASISGLSPIYRVRSASRTVGAKIEELRAIAIATGKPLGIRYTFNQSETEQDYFQMIPPAPEEFPDEPLESRKMGISQELPVGVRFGRITFPGGSSIDQGTVDIIFSSMGNTGSHVVTLQGRSSGDRPIVISLKFNAITGTLDFSEGEAGFETHES